MLPELPRCGIHGTLIAGHSSVMRIGSCVAVTNWGSIYFPVVCLLPRRRAVVVSQTIAIGQGTTLQSFPSSCVICTTTGQVSSELSPHRAASVTMTGVQPEGRKSDWPQCKFAVQQWWLHRAKVRRCSGCIFFCLHCMPKGRSSIRTYCRWLWPL